MINYIENYGYTNTMINKNNKKSNVSMEWAGNYDGNMADLTVKLNDNGSKKVVDLKLDNQDLINLLNIPSHQSSLHERLSHDIIDQQPLHIIELPMVSLPNRKKRRKTRNKKNKLRSRTKKILDLF
jgi:hypothetical protein